MKRFFVILMMTASLAASSLKAQNQVIDNNTVIELLQTGFGSQEIIGLLDASSERNITFDISFMKNLKEAGADSDLIVYLQKITKVDFGYEGILWWNPTDGGKPKKLHRTSFEMESKKASGGLLGIAGAITGVTTGSRLGTAATVALIGSEGSMKKVVMQGHTSKVRLEGENGRNPVFRFYLPKKEGDSFQKTADNWYYTMMSAIESPNEFQCIRMKQKKSKRSFPDGISYSVAGFSAKKATRDIVEFEIKDISNNIFEVTFTQPLEPGEYCFFYKHGANNTIFAEHMFGFDFTVF